MEEIVTQAELISYQCGINGYINYVFRNLEPGERYIMCVRVPNWEQPEEFSLRDKGKLVFANAKAGDGKHKYTFTQFIRFIPENLDEKRIFI